MIEQYSESNETERLDFARKAARHFEDNPDSVTFSNDGPEKGKLMALRWGMGNDCVLVFRVSDDYDDKIINYPQFIARDKAELTFAYHKSGMAAISQAKK